jgi:hypothetical protein
VDSVMFRTTTLGVFNEAVELCFFPPFDRSIKQDPNVTFKGCKAHDCKNLLLAYGGASMIRWDCHLVLPKIQKTSRFDTRQLTHKQMVSRRLPASKRCDGQGGLRSVVTRVAIATGQLQMMMVIILKLCAR